MTDRLRRNLIALVSGGLLSLAFPPFNLWPLAVVAPLLLLWQCHALPPWAAFRLAWLFGFGQFVTGVWWVFISTHVYGGAPAILSALMVPVLAAYLALYPALAIGLWRWLGTPLARPWALLLVLPACWCLAEFMRGWVMGGFPWFSLGYVATQWAPLGKLAAVVGVHGVSLVLIAMAGALLLVGLSRRPIWLVPLLVLPGLSALPQPSAWTSPVGEPLDVVILQGNMPQDQKWLRANREPTKAIYRVLTERAWPVDLVLWPEVAIPSNHLREQEYLEQIGAAASQAQGTVFVGIITRHEGRAYNTVYALGDDAGRYVKQHLVPFGEYLPVPAWVQPALKSLALPIPQISTGLSGQPWLTVDGLPVALSICFEDLFPNELRARGSASGLLANVTNDAWFAGSGAPRQHLQISRLRALEAGRPMLRAANTGISALIDADGQVGAQLNWDQRGALRGQVQPRQGQTPYLRWGHWPHYALIAFAVIMGLLGRGGLLPLAAFSAHKQGA